MSQSTAVNSMFGRIAGRYDFANRVLSGGRDSHWRAGLVHSVEAAGARSVLDLATGSGDVAFALARALPDGSRILGVDFCEPMLERARKKKAAAPGHFSGVEFRSADVLSLPFSNGAFDAATIAFGIRNLEDRARGLREMRRVLRTGGKLFILEFSQPQAWFRPIYFLYLRVVVPLLAGLLTGEPSAYEYLGATIGAFPDRDALSGEIRAAGFTGVRAVPLTLGIVAIHEAVAP